MIDRPGRCQLLQAGISEQQSCYCQSSVLVHCATHSYAHGRAHTQMQMRMDTHRSACKNTCGRTHIPPLSYCHSNPHTHTHTLSLCNAPAVKSQLNNESPALPPFCIEVEELVISCIEHYVCVGAFPPSCTVSSHGETYHEAPRRSGHACPSPFRYKG